MKTSHFTAAALVAGLLLVGAGCISFSSGTANSGADGGIFKTANRGDGWLQKTAIPTTDGSHRSMSSVSVTSIVQDPEDPNALYIGTTDSGMLYTYDGGESWMQPAQVSSGAVPSVAVDPKNKCVVYVAIENKLLKTVDCSRTWSTTYLDTRTDKLTTAVAVDFYDSNIIWVANNSGDLLKSTDAGASWVNVKSFMHPIMKLMLNAADSRKVYVATKDAGVWRSADAGATWTDLSTEYSNFAGSNEFYDIAGGVSDPNTVVIATKYGLLRSTDGGDKWAPVELLTPPGTTLIYSVALDPKDTNNLYYGTATTFYRSPNAGTNWVPKKLPTGRAATELLVDRTNQDVLYMGVTKFK